MSTSLVPLLDDVRNFIQRDHGCFIDGRWVLEGKSDLPVFDPATGQAISRIVDASAELVDRAVRSAQAAFDQGVWSRRLPVERERILLRFADLLECHAEELAQLETLEQGKSINISRGFEVACAQNWMRYAAGLATKITGQTLDVSIPMPAGARYMAYTRREPLGVVAGILPWNFPLLIGMWKVMPALAAGCSIVIKPSEVTPLTMMRMAELAIEAGVPPGVFNLVCGRGASCGQALISHPLVRKISFTGSTDTGKAIARTAADRLTHTTLELGGKNPAIVLADADLQQTVEGLMLGSFLNQGQVCAASSRLYVEAPIFEELSAMLTGAIKSMTLGPGLDASAQINPLVSRDHQLKVQAYLDDARQHADLISGQAVPAGEGFYVSPTLVLNPAPQVRLAHEEVFGPVVNLIRVADRADALNQANNSDFGLTASLWTRDLNAALDLIPRIEAGTVWVNSHTLIDDNMPFGGYKQSGIGRDFGTNWLDAYTEQKSVCIRH